MGESKKILKNAKKMGINLEDVDYLILSHGHYDHGGGLPYFLEVNKKAKIYCSVNYFNKHFKKILGTYIDIGVPHSYMDVERFNLIEDTFELENMTMFHCNNVQNNNPLNECLYTKDEFDDYVKDDFNHELNIVVKEDENILLTGCAHKGIGNILRRAKELNYDSSVVIGGLHFSSRTTLNKNEEYIKKSIKKINKYNVRALYTCHCTGDYGVKKLKEYAEALTVQIHAGDREKI